MFVLHVFYIGGVLRLCSILFSIILPFTPSFIFVRTVFVQNGKCSPFSRTHSHASTNATRRHEYFRGLSRLLPVPGVLVSFLELRFLRKLALLALGGRPQSLKQPSQSQKGHFYKKKNALNDTKTPDLSKSAKGTGNICDRLWHL